MKISVSNSVVGWTVARNQICSCPNFYEIYECDLFGKWVFTDIIKDLKVKSFWVIWMGPKSKMTSILIRDNMEERQKKGQHCDTGEMQPQTRSAHGHQTLQEARNRMTPRAPRGRAVLLTHWVWTLAFRTVRTHFCHFKPPRWWQFVMAALEKHYRWNKVFTCKKLNL